MSHEDDRVELHKLFTEVLVAATGMHEHLASAFMVAFTMELSRRMGQTELWIPANPLRGVRDDCIREDLRNGSTPAQVAQAYNVSERTVYRLIAAD